MNSLFVNHPDYGDVEFPIDTPEPDILAAMQALEQDNASLPKVPEQPSKLDTLQRTGIEALQWFDQNLGISSNIKSFDDLLGNLQEGGYIRRNTANYNRPEIDVGKIGETVLNALGTIPMVGPEMKPLLGILAGPIGMNGKLEHMMRYKEFIEAEKAGKLSRKDMWRQFGFGRAKDDNIRWEIGDEFARYDTSSVNPVHPDYVAYNEQILKEIEDKYQSANVPFEDIPLQDKNAYKAAMEALQETLSTGGRSRPLPEVLKHDELYSAYPELKEMKVKVLSAKDFHEEHPNSGLSKSIRGWVNDKNIVILTHPGDTEEDVLKFLIHESQHVVQNIESFAPGDNIKDALPELKKMLPVYIADLRTVLDDAVAAGAPEKDINEISERIRDLRLLKSDVDEGRVSAADAYFRSHGEQEARNAETRLFYDKVDRRMVPFWESMKLDRFTPRGEDVSIVNYPEQLTFPPRK